MKYALSVEITNGRDERIRTSDPSVPNAVLYQTEPRPDPDIFFGSEKNIAKEQYRIFFQKHQLSQLSAIFHKTNQVVIEKMVLRF